MSTIHLRNLTFAYDGGEPVFSDVSLQIDPRWKLGLIGRNGRGKTTLLRLLAGELEYSGKIDSPLEFDLFPFAVKENRRPTREIVEEIADFEPWQLERELSLLEVSEDVLSRPFDTLSGGERTKIMLAALFLKENRFLLIDEPTNHLDLRGRETVGKYLERKKGFVLVSHDRVFLDRCVDHVLSINRDDLELIQGNFSTWQRERDDREKFEAAENRRLGKEIRRLRDSANNVRDWSQKAEKEKYGNGPVDRGFVGSKAARIMKRAQSTSDRFEKAAEEKSKLFKNSEIEDDLSVTPLRFHSDRLLDLEDVSIRIGEKTLFEGFSLTVRQGERIALAGPNGCGKSSLLQSISGEKLPDVMEFSGRRNIPSALKISRLPQDASFLSGRMDDWIEERRIDESRFKTILHKLGFPREDFERDMSEFSAGRKKKILLAAVLCERAHLYLWDEPLNYIDVISRIQIERLILECRPTLVFVEHDQKFLETVATRIVDLRGEIRNP